MDQGFAQGEGVPWLVGWLSSKASCDCTSAQRPVLFPCTTDPNDYVLKDPKGEATYRVKLTDALNRARKLKAKGSKGVLDGLTFYASPKVDVKTIKHM